MPFQELYAAAQFGYRGAGWHPPFIFHGIDSDAGHAAARHAVEEGTARHVRHLKRCFP